MGVSKYCNYQICFIVEKFVSWGLKIGVRKFVVFGCPGVVNAFCFLFGEDFCFALGDDFRDALGVPQYLSSMFCLVHCFGLTPS